MEIRKSKPEYMFVDERETDGAQVTKIDRFK